MDRYYSLVSGEKKSSNEIKWVQTRAQINLMQSFSAGGVARFQANILTHG
jgi:hypothetical protein